MGLKQALVVSTPAILEARNLARWIAREGVPNVTVDRSNGEWGVFAPASALGRARAAFKRVISNPAGPFAVLAKGTGRVGAWTRYGPVCRKLRGAIDLAHYAVRRHSADKAVVMDLPRGRVRFAAFRRGAAANPVTPVEARELSRMAGLLRRAAANPRVLLLTQEDRRRLPPLYSQENVKDPLAQVKFFTPDSNWTWFALEFDQKDTFFGLVQGHEEELGYFTLSEMSRARGPMGLAIERDMHFRPTPLSRLRKGGGPLPNRRGRRRNPLGARERALLRREASRLIARARADSRAGHKGAAEYWKGKAAGLAEAAASGNPAGPVNGKAAPCLPYTLVVMGQRIGVRSWSEASNAVGVIRTRTGLGYSKMGAEFPIYRGRTIVAYVSYNGKVWKGKPGDWPKAKLLYNPFANPGRRNPLSLAPMEIDLLNRFKDSVEHVERRSRRIFDLTIKGTELIDRRPYQFSAWAPLKAIAELTRWTSPEIARMTDYPEMVREGDWSGIRDSSNEKIWAIFHRFVLPKLGRPGSNPRRRSRR